MPALCSSAGILLFLSAVVKSKKCRQAAEGFVYSLILKHHGRQKESATISKKQNLTPALLDIHLHCLVLDGVYLNRDGAAVFHEAAPPTVEELEALLAKIIQRVMRLLTRPGALIEE